MVALFLARRGWHVVYLGASLPADGLAERLARIRPTAVVLSASTEQAAESLAGMAARLERLSPPRPVVGYGGRVFEEDPSRRDRVMGVYLGPDAAAAADLLERALVGNRP
jgi:methanogenic corrinoid protein MtbC1